MITLLVAAVFLVVGGIVYLGVFGYGLAVDQDSVANWLHLGPGVGMIVTGVLLHLRLRDVRDSAEQ